MNAVHIYLKSKNCVAVVASYIVVYFKQNQYEDFLDRINISVVECLLVLVCVCNFRYDYVCSNMVVTFHIVSSGRIGLQMFLNRLITT